MQTKIVIKGGKTLILKEVDPSKVKEARDIIYKMSKRKVKMES